MLVEKNFRETQFFLCYLNGSGYQCFILLRISEKLRSLLLKTITLYLYFWRSFNDICYDNEIIKKTQ